MNNSIRHGNATLLTIVFKQESDRIVCNYTDNGVGFNILDDKNHCGLGMKNISSRISFLKGTLDLNSTVNEGVAVVFKF
jgi:signal transduction histidine kinase